MKKVALFTLFVFCAACAFSQQSTSRQQSVQPAQSSATGQHTETPQTTEPILQSTEKNIRFEKEGTQPAEGQQNRNSSVPISNARKENP